MRYERVKVKRDTNTVHNVLVRPWEVPLLEFIFGEGNIEFLDEFEQVKDRDGNTDTYPEAAKELERLCKVYGSDPKSGVAHANSVYGNARAGVRTLAKLIDEAKAEDAKAAKAPAKKATAKPRRARSELAESLLS